MLDAECLLILQAQEKRGQTRNGARSGRKRTSTLTDDCPLADGTAQTILVMLIRQFLQHLLRIVIRWIKLQRLLIILRRQPVIAVVHISFCQAVPRIPRLREIFRFLTETKKRIPYSTLSA